MAELVNTKRRYDASRRRRHAGLTRARVLDVAERLFVHRGYAAVSIPDIANEADVSVQSVYASFGNKRKLLQELIRTRVGGDESALSIWDREWFHHMLAEPDPERLLRLHAKHARRIAERVASLNLILQQAAGADPELAADYRLTHSRRHEEQSAITRELAQRKALRRGLKARAAADILWALSGPETYEALVIERGWSPDAYERWLADTLVSTLLPPSARA